MAGCSPRGRWPACWLWVVLPFGYGVYELIRKVTRLFS